MNSLFYIKKIEIQNWVGAWGFIYFDLYKLQQQDSIVSFNLSNQLSKILKNDECPLDEKS